MSGLVGVKYEDNELPLLQCAELKKVWEPNPLKVSIYERIAVLGSGISVLLGTSKAFEVAEFKINEIASTILRIIVKDHNDSIHDYKEKLKEYTERDFQIIEANKRDFKVKDDYFILFYLLLKLRGTQFKERVEIDREAQTYRYLWFVEVHTSEAARRKRVKFAIENAFPALIETLKDMRQQGVLHREKCLEAWQLRKVYNSIFGVPKFEEGQDDRARLNAQTEFELHNLLPSDTDMQVILKDYLKEVKGEELTC